MSHFSEAVTLIFIYIYPPLDSCFQFGHCVRLASKSGVRSGARGPGLASELFAMSQIMLIDLKIRYSVSTVNIYTLGDGCKNSLLVSKSCTHVIPHSGTFNSRDSFFDPRGIFLNRKFSGS